MNADGSLGSFETVARRRTASRDHGTATAEECLLFVYRIVGLELGADDYMTKALLAARAVLV